jgi:hypothetical protein
MRSALLRSLRLFELLAAAREADDETARLHLLVRALERANFRRRHTFDPSVVAALHRCIDIDTLLDDGSVFIRGSIGRPLDDEVNLPERRAVLGSQGERGDLREANYRFFPLNGIDLYHMLDWMRADAEAN